jgi:hypothetical protein
MDPLRKIDSHLYYILHPFGQSAIGLDDKLLSFGGGLKIS